MKKLFYLRKYLIFRLLINFKTKLKTKLKEIKEKKRERYVIFSFYKNGKFDFINKTNNIYYAEEFSRDFIEDIGQRFQISIKIFFLDKKENLKSLIEKIKEGKKIPMIEINS